MDGGVKLPWGFNLPYRGGVQFSIRGFNIPWMKIDPGVNLPWDSKYHMTGQFFSKKNETTVRSFRWCYF